MMKKRLSDLARAEGVALTVVGPAEDEDFAVWVSVGDAVLDGLTAASKGGYLGDHGRAEEVIAFSIRVRLRIDQVEVRVTDRRVHFALVDAMGRLHGDSWEYFEADGGMAIC